MVDHSGLVLDVWAGHLRVVPHHVLILHERVLLEGIDIGLIAHHLQQVLLLLQVRGLFHLIAWHNLYHRYLPLHWLGVLRLRQLALGRRRLVLPILLHHLLLVA